MDSALKTMIKNENTTKNNSSVDPPPPTPLLEGLLGQDVVEVLKVDNTITVQVGSLNDLPDVLLWDLLTKFLKDSRQVVSLKGTVPVLVEELEDSVDLVHGVLVGNLGAHDVQELTELNLS